MSRKVLIACVVLAAVSGLGYVVGGVVDKPLLLRFSSKIGMLIGSVGVSLIWGSRRTLGERRADGFVLNLIVLSVTGILLLGLGEVAMRVLLRDVTTTPDNSSYFAKRWDRLEVRRNSLGFREREFERVKPPGVFRIAVIGDSFTFGQGVAEGQRYTNLLETELNRGPRPLRFEVLNFGRAGAQTIDHIRMLEEAVQAGEPDFILLEWFVNDPEGKDTSMRPIPTPLFGSSTLQTYLHPASALYYVANFAWRSFQERLGRIENYQDYMVRRFGDPNQADSREAARLLREFIELCRKHGKPLGIVLFPVIGPELRTGYKLAFLHERVLADCARDGIDCVDLREAFAEFPDARTLWVSRFDSHPGPAANRIAADRLLRRFEPVWAGDARRSSNGTDRVMPVSNE
ncbi:MAG TPA: SGNH/GDSL hydrolase family protein [Bdellovibrionota bacterium]|nr:SGNH/GDSL hydrolase family protein [Bdellovibrionota bacterium]